MQEIIFYSYSNTNVLNNKKYYDFIRQKAKLSTDLVVGKFWYENKSWYRFLYNSDSKELFDWIDNKFSLCYWEDINWLREMPKEIEISYGPRDKQYFVYLGSKAIPVIHENFCSFTSLAAESLSESNFKHYIEIQKLIKQAQNGILQVIFWSKE